MHVYVIYFNKTKLLFCYRILSLTHLKAVLMGRGLGAPRSPLWSTAAYAWLKFWDRLHASLILYPQRLNEESRQ